MAAPGNKMTRRKFLGWMGTAAAAALLPGCGTEPTDDRPTALPVDYVTDTPAKTRAPRYQVAVSQIRDYDSAVIYRDLVGMLDSLGGLAGIVSSGSKVAIKINLTGGQNFTPPTGYSATESYLTHPAVVTALGHILLDAGASTIYLVEGIFDAVSYQLFGYESVAKELGAQLVDLNLPDPYKDYVKAGVGTNALVYQEFDFNPLLSEVDAFISVAKMKCHYDAGVTLSMKNLVGLLPVTRYRISSDHWWRSAIHEGGQARLGKVILDLNRARPVNLAVIDGIQSAEGGEVPRGSFQAIQPGLLVVGKNAVATDAVSSALMGFDPLQEPPKAPFLKGINYLNLASQSGMGSNQLQDITVIGPAIEDVKVQFKPSTTQ